MKICMIGAGYVGLVSAACFSEFGWQVTCVDKDVERVDQLRRNRIPIYEPGLDDLVARNAGAGRLAFTSDISTAVSDADVVFLAVGTPMRRGDGHADLSYIFAAVEEIAPHLSGFTVIATKSTVPVGTSRRIEHLLERIDCTADVTICSNPEFLREGSALQDFMHPDRILIGCDDRRTEDVMRKLYKPISLRESPVIVTSRESAELAKYAANAFLAMKVTFINEIADLCEQLGADVQEVAKAVGEDRRIGTKFLHPGPGFGGSCFPKDVSALIRTAREYRSPVTLIEAVQHLNEERKIDMARRVRDALGGSAQGKTIGILGVTFKPNTDDVREAPSLTILPILAADGARLRVYDPEGCHQAAPLLPMVEWCDSALDAADEADVLVILTEWNEFRALDLKAVRNLMRGRDLLDFRNVFRPEDAVAAGFAYSSIGRRLDRMPTRSGSVRRLASDASVGDAAATALGA